MNLYKRKPISNWSVKDILNCFFGGLFFSGIICFEFIFDYALGYITLTFIIGMISILISFLERFIYLKEIKVEDHGVTFSRAFLFFTLNKKYCINNIKFRRTYYSLILDCLNPGDFESSKFYLTTTNWNCLDELEQDLVTKKYS